ncbi:MAG: methyl-accepting chemotaxis protein [Verrucomicrobiae bacterium]|nr:methyl-accepting chemotaxis protein [Verrucomicrobiae bacterium]
MKLRTQIALLSLSLVGASTLVVLATLVFENRRLERESSRILLRTVEDQVGQVTAGAYRSVLATEARNQRRLDHSLGVARALLESHGRLGFGTGETSWKAVNQFTGEASEVSLPTFLLGGVPIVANTDGLTPSPLVDDVRRTTREFCTLFQRINDAGDMLRVVTSVLHTNGTRAVGTFIPALQPDGTPNPVVREVLAGRTFRGRARVVGEWHATAYEPVWDPTRTHVIGMLYVGLELRDINRELLASLQAMRVGQSGSMFVLGASGADRGRYILSPGGRRDGEAALEARDALGQPYVQSLLAKAGNHAEGTVTLDRYSLPIAGRTTNAAVHVAAVTYHAPYDWVIGVEAPEQDFAEVLDTMASAQDRLLRRVSAVAAVIGILGLLAGTVLARRIERPMARVANTLEGACVSLTDASSHLASAGQQLAEGASEQAASVEETSASLEEMASMIRGNAGNAGRAKNLAASTRSAADRGAREVQQLQTAMESIQSSSDDIARILKTIDEIAFQTNILALNAAVEAARAGDAGMGFGVVADEVRALAQRSAGAARDTAARIETALAATAQGVEVGGRVAVVLNEIHQGVRQVDEIAAEVASASQEQSQGIAQVNTALSQIDRVTQVTASSSEEVAASAGDLTSQVATMRESLEALRIMFQGRDARSRAASVPVAATAPRSVPLRARAGKPAPALARG